MKPTTSRMLSLTAVPLVVLLLGTGVPLAQTQGTDPNDPSLITLTTENTPVVEVLQALADRSGLNIVTGGAVQAQTVSIRLRNTPFDTALTLICRASGLGYERIGNSVLVTDPQSLSASSGLVPRVYDLDHADAATVHKSIEQIATNVEADVKGNQVVAWGPANVMDAVDHTVAQMDRRPQQVQLTARFFEVNTSRLSEIGIDWDKITNWTSIFTQGDPGLSPTDQIPPTMGFTEVGEYGKVHSQLEALEVTLDALITEGSARLLSNTNVVTLDGVPAEIFAGETVPVVITSLQSPGQGGGVFQTVQLEKIDVGVRLNILPRITSDGYITTLVEPEVSRIVAFVGPDDDLPQTSTRRAKTSVRVRDGEKIYLGGLLTEETRKTVEKVPLLGSIPLLGFLFQHHREETQQLDLVIEVTPRIVGDSGSSLPTNEMSLDEGTGSR